MGTLVLIRYGLSAGHCLYTVRPEVLQSKILAFVGLLNGCKANFSTDDYYDHQGIAHLYYPPNYQGPDARDVGTNV